MGDHSRSPGLSPGKYTSPPSDGTAVFEAASSYSALAIVGHVVAAKQQLSTVLKAKCHQARAINVLKTK